MSNKMNRGKPKRWFFESMEVGEIIVVPWEPEEKLNKWGTTYGRIRSALGHARRKTGYRFSSKAFGTLRDGGIRVTRTA